MSLDLNECVCSNGINWWGTLVYVYHSRRRQTYLLSSDHLHKYFYCILNRIKRRSQTNSPVLCWGHMNRNLRQSSYNKYYLYYYKSDKKISKIWEFNNTWTWENFLSVYNDQWRSMEKYFLSLREKEKIIIHCCLKPDQQ